jgi:hypothetical protein
MSRWFFVVVVLAGLAGATTLDTTVIRAACSAQAGDECLYRPEQTYDARVLPDQTIVDETRGGREVGVRIRLPIGAPEPMPVIVFSHGGGPKPPGNFGNQEWGAALAGAGYVVVHLSHSLNDADRDWACGQLAAGDPCDVVTALTMLRPGDASAAIRELLDAGTTVPALAGKLDLDRIAVAGHSFGSYTALTLAGTTVDPGPASETMSFADPVPVSFLALSPSGPGHFGFTEDSFLAVDRPVMMMSGRGDRTSGEQPVDRHTAFDLLPPGDKMLVWIDDPASSHDTFNLANPAEPEMVAWVASAGVAWFDATLRDDADAWAWLASQDLATASGGSATITTK